MIAPGLESAIAGLKELIEEARVIAPFTGAGISTECGIPDFRSPGGLWATNRPIGFDEFLASQEMRNESWRRCFASPDCRLPGITRCTHSSSMRKVGSSRCR